jgi:hypothetical protein
MKQTIISVFVALLATVTVQAQQIAVVSGDETTMYQTLAEAIEGAKSGSTIYLPGGGFQTGNINILKRLTIIGIGHKANSENVDGNTTLSGNIGFGKDSDGSAIMGCYISGDVIIGQSGSSSVIVNNVQVKHCNINSIQIKDSRCTGTIINQNYIRSSSDCGNASVEFTNNVMNQLCGVRGGFVKYNIIFPTSTVSSALYFVQSSTICYNILGKTQVSSGGDVSDNMFPGDWGDNCINMSNKDWNDVFKTYNGGKISPTSDFNFTEDYQEYSNIGIYGGNTKFSDSGMAPVPFIESKDIPDKTDAAGMLNIKIRVKASE